MEEFTSWSTNEKNDGVNPLTNRQEIGFPENEQEAFAKQYLHLAQKLQGLSDISMQLLKKINSTMAEMDLSPEINEKLLEQYHKELSSNLDKESQLQNEMQQYFDKMDEENKQKYLTVSRPEVVN